MACPQQHRAARAVPVPRARAAPEACPGGAWRSRTAGCPRALGSAWQRLACLRRLLDGIDEAVQVNRGVERGHAVLTGADRLGEQGIHLPDIERIAAREVGRDIHEALGDLQVAERVVATRALQAQRLTA